MYTEDLMVRELYSDIYSTRVIAELFRRGIELYGVKLTISAMEELVRRGEYDLIAEELDYAFSHGRLHQDSNLLIMTAKVLCLRPMREQGKWLTRYGRFLLSGGFMGPSEWLRCMEQSEEVSEKRLRVAGLS